MLVDPFVILIMYDVKLILIFIVSDIFQKLLESKYQNVLQSKNKYKEKWACSVRDLNKLKSLNSADTHPHQTHENHFMENNNNELINIGISNHMQQYKHFNHKNERLNKSEMNFKATSTTTDYYEDGYRDCESYFP